MENGSLKVWWIPQVPMKAFEVTVKDLHEARKIMNVLADYDRFQFENRVKPDYCNVGGLQIWDERLEPDEDGEKWCDWYDEETGDDFDAYCEEHEIV